MNHQEIERRFLITKLRGGVEFLEKVASQRKAIRQGYFEIADPNKSFRVRITSDVFGPYGVVTIKSGNGMIRGEFERSLDIDVACSLFDICQHHIYKTRYCILGWEIDVFEMPLEGIILAEKEMSSVDEETQLPDFIEESIEVTDSLTNLHLARLATELRGTGIPALPFVSERLLSPIPCIVVTGGPCSGKSTVMNTLKSEFPNAHFVPEVASIIIGQVGIKPSRNSLRNNAFQRAVYRTGRIFRTTSIEFASAENKKAVVFDRGEADGAAYFDGGADEFEKVIGTKIEEEYRNIAMVICLEVPPREIYEQKKANNPSRSESYEEAIALGERTKAAWNRHPGFHQIGNENGWDAKVDKVRQLIKTVVKR